MPKGVPKNRLVPPAIEGAVSGQNVAPESPTLPQSETTPKNDELTKIIRSLAISINTVAAEVKKIKEDLAKTSPASPTSNPLHQSTQTQSSQAFLDKKEDEGGPQIPETSSVPINLLKTARAVLGPKFSFRCEASPDLPQFTFTVIVPPEYSPFKGVHVDERSRVIPNPLGVNGVEEWCKTVKANVIKFLGANLPTNVL